MPTLTVHTSARRIAAGLLALLMLAAALIVVPSSEAIPSGNRAGAGYGSPDDGALTVNGYGGSESWWGSYRLSGPSGWVNGYCIDHGMWYPSATVSAVSDPLGGVPSDQREALSYLLDRYGDTSNDLDAAAMALVVHDLVAQADGGTSTWNLAVNSMTLGAGWPANLENDVKARALTLVHEGFAARGPYNVQVSLDGRGSGWPAVRAQVTVAGPAGPIAGQPVQLTFTNGPGPVTVVTNAAGHAAYDYTVPNPNQQATVTGTASYQSGGFDVFRGGASTQRVITRDPDRRVATDSARLIDLAAPQQEARLEMVKLGVYDQDTSNATGAWPLTGATFDVTDASNAFVGRFRVTNAAGTAVEVVAGTLAGDANNNGREELAVDPADSPFTITETVVPYPYNLNNGIVEPATSGPITVTVNGVNSATLSNRIYEQPFRLRKVSDTPAYTSATASLDLFRDSDNNGSYETYMDTVAVGSAWEILSLPPGEYRAVETTVSNGHILGGPFDFTVGVLTPGTVEFPGLTITNEQPRSRARIAKTGQFPQYLDVTGSVFELHYDADNNGSYETPVSDPGGVAVQANGFTPWVDGLRPGNYQWVETDPASGYSAQTETFTLAVGSSVSHTADVENAAPATSLILVKTTTSPYQGGEGTVFTVEYDSTNDGTYDTLISDSATIDSTGRAVLNGLDPGNYRITETDPAEGLLAGDPIEVFIAMDSATVIVGTADVVNNGTTTTVTITNEVASDSALALVKVDQDTNELLEGAMLLVEYDSTNDGTYDTEIGTFRTATTPVDISGLTAGNYQVTEVSPPPGYTLPEPADRVVQITLTYGDTTTPDDNVTLITVTFADLMPQIATQVIDPAAIDDPDTTADERETNTLTFADGIQVADRATVTNVASDITGTITAVLYGPFTSADEIACTTATEAGRVTFDVVGSGTFDSPPITVPLPGIYTFVETWTGSDNSTATHACGMDTETITVVGPSIRTQVVDPDATDDPDTPQDERARHQFAPGEPVADSVIVSNVNPSTVGEVIAVLYGPFAHVDDITCTPDMAVESVTFTVTGSGTFTSPPITPDAGGIYTFVETWTEQLPPGNTRDPLTATHECGMETETFTVPALTTEASGQHVTVNEPIWDTATLTGVLPGVSGQVQFVAYHPANDGTWTCTDDLVAWTSEPITTNGPGEYVSSRFTPTMAGPYTFVATWTAEQSGLRDRPVTATHDCGAAAETFTVHPAITTTVASTDVTVGGMVQDVAVLEGAPDGMQGEVTFNLYGPFDHTKAMACTPDTMAATSTVPTRGSGTVESDDHRVDMAGLYTFVATWQSDDGYYTATHDCGLEVETAAAHPTITTQVSHQTATTDTAVYDTAMLTGVPESMSGVVTFVLYGPFATADDVACTADMAVASQTVDAVGSDLVVSEPITVSDTGVYTFVASWKATAGDLAATHDCGLVEETVTFTALTPPPFLSRTGLDVWQLIVASLLTTGAGLMLLRRFRRHQTNAFAHA